MIIAVLGKCGINNIIFSLFAKMFKIRERELEGKKEKRIRVGSSACIITPEHIKI